MGRKDEYKGSGYFPPNGAPQQKRRPPERPRVNPLRLCVLIACVGVFCFCAYELAHYFSDILRTRGSTAELSGLYQAAQTAESAVTAAPDEPRETEPPAAPPTDSPVASAEANQPTAALLANADAPKTVAPLPTELWPAGYENNPRLAISSRFLDLLEKNEDIVGWLTIKGVVDEPVVQRDNAYYLTRNASRQKSVTGALFLDEACDLRTVSTQMIVHGHNMKEGAMFGSLKKYKVLSAAFYRENAYITFNTLYEDARYVIFAALETDVRYGQKDYLPFWQYPRFTSTDEFDDYIAKARALSHYACGVEVTAGDRLLTLSTCSGDDDNKRFLVMARRVRDGEDLFTLQTQVLRTSDR